ncbi:DinB family protein [Nocardiopsis sp. NPDC049922]|uniref:DinB family protein n=1 Tax=Nocardiopsis sp. NPDC049922 TaxID=3155157 RepID=UPI0034015942
MSELNKRADLFLEPGSDPRMNGPRLGDERATLREFLRLQRLTLEIKCEGLSAGELACRSVEPSTMSLLGLVRHMAEVERIWFRRRLSGLDAPPLFCTPQEPDAEFDGAVADPEVVAHAWRVWREETAFTDDFVARTPSLDATFEIDRHGRMSLREVLVHMIEEYARHNGHADLLRERIDGRVGQ